MQLLDVQLTMFWVKFPHCITAVVNRSRASLGHSSFIISRSEKLKGKSCRFREHMCGIQRATPASPDHCESVMQKRIWRRSSRDGLLLEMKMWSEVKCRRNTHLQSNPLQHHCCPLPTLTRLAQAHHRWIRGNNHSDSFVLQVFWNCV